MPASPDSVKWQEIHRRLTLLELCLERQWWLVGTRNRTEEVFGTYSLASHLPVECLAGLTDRHLRYLDTIYEQNRF